MVFGYDGEDEELEVIDEDNNYVGTVTQAPDVGFYYSRVY